MIVVVVVSFFNSNDRSSFRSFSFVILLVLSSERCGTAVVAAAADFEVFLLHVIAPAKVCYKIMRHLKRVRLCTMCNCSEGDRIFSVSSRFIVRDHIQHHNYLHRIRFRGTSITLPYLMGYKINKVLEKLDKWARRAVETVQMRVHTCKCKINWIENQRINFIKFRYHYCNLKPVTSTCSHLWSFHWSYKLIYGNWRMRMLAANTGI